MNINNGAYKFFNHKLTIWIPVFLGILGIITVVLYINFPSAYNQGIYHYQGLVLKNGGLPYTGFIEKKGPMGLLTYSLASIIFGDTVVGYRIFDLCILTITGFFLFRLVILKYSKSIGWLVSILWLQHILIDGPGNTGDVTNIITACSVALAYCLLVPKLKNRYFFTGILIALACWVKPTALLIAIPLLLLLFTKSKNDRFEFNKKALFKIVIGMVVPTFVFIAYLLISGTFYAFWEVVVLDTVFHYAGNISRLSPRILFKSGSTFLNDPVARIGGILSLFILSRNTTLKLIVIGIGLMLFIEGRLFPYQFSILWPFLTYGVIEGFIVLSQKISQTKQRVLVGLFCILMAFPVFKTGSAFIQAGFLTSNFDVEQTFLVQDFRTMYRYRKSAVSYLKTKINTNDELLVLGQDPNIYLELGVVTSCRFAREGFLLVEELTTDTPPHLIAWQEELIEYMEDRKADWIIVLKTLPEQWARVYSEEIHTIFLKKYALDHTTEGHLIYKKI